MNSEDSIKKLGKFIKDKEICRKIEKGIVKFSKEYVITKRLDEKYFLIPIYESKLGDIIKNIDYNSELNNHYFVIKLITREINPYDVAYYTPQELFPDKWEKIIKQIEFIEEKSKNIATCIRKVPCRNCGDNRATISQLQTRSADEPMTTFITCCSCGVTKKY